MKHDLNAARTHRIIDALTNVTVADTDYQGHPRQRAHAVQEAPLATEAVLPAEGGQLCPRTTIFQSVLVGHRVEATRYTR